MFTHLEANILECEFKLALRNITTYKASERDGIPVELFQVLKGDAVKVLHSICQQTWKTQQWLQDWKRSPYIQIPKKINAKECSNYHTVALISLASKVRLKVLQARLHQYVNKNFQMYKIYKRQWNQRLNCQQLLNHRKSKGITEKHLLLY